MASSTVPPERARIRRLPELGVVDPKVRDAIIDAAPFATIATIEDGWPVATATLVARDGSRLLLHGSRSNRSLGRGNVDIAMSISFVCYDGLIVARSGYNHSVAYRSVVVFGTAVPIVDHDDKRRALDLLVDAMLPGRTSEIRQPTPEEIDRTTVLSLAIEASSTKVSTGPPEDFPEDLDSEVWAGVLPAHIEYLAPQPAVDGAMQRVLIEVPPSVRRVGGLER